MQRNVVLLSKTIVAQLFKLLTGLHHSCNFKFLSIGQHAYSNHRDDVAVITVKLFDQTLLADVEMLYITGKETVFASGVWDGAPLMDCTHPCLVALAAASHWKQHMHWPSHTGCNSTSGLFAVQLVICSLKSQATPLWECLAIGCSSCRMRSGTVGASMLSSAVTVA
jgi:hypothetical protein